MTLVRRGPDLDEPVDLLDDEWRTATTVTRTSTTGRRRWPEALLVGAALAVVIGIGATGDDGSDEATNMPRRTTTTAVRRSTTTTTPRPTTTATTFPASVAGTGPVLGAGVGPTETSLLIAEQGTLAVLDLDTGDLCRTDANGTGAWYTYPQPGMHAELEVNDDQGRSLLIDATCGLRPSNRQYDGGWAVANTATGVWTMEDGPVQRLHQRTHDGEVVRTIDVPAYSGLVADDEWVVLAVAGEMVAIELATDREVSLGAGHPMGIGGGRLVAIRCERLECALVLIDVSSGRARDLDLPMPMQWEPATLSPDGRWLSFGMITEDGQSLPVLADLESGELVDTRGGPCAFSNDSRWLLCVRPSVVEAVSLEDGRIVDLTDLFDRPTNGFGVMLRDDG